MSLKRRLRRRGEEAPAHRQTLDPIARRVAVFVPRADDDLPRADFTRLDNVADASPQSDASASHQHRHRTTLFWK